MERLTSKGHAQENAENVVRQQRYQHIDNDTGNDVVKLFETVAEHVVCTVGYAHTHDKREDQRTHHIEQGGNLDFKVRQQVFGLGNSCHATGACHHVGEQPRTSAIGQQSSQNGVDIGYHDGDNKQFAGCMTNIGNGRGNKAHNDEWNHELEELAENAVERDENAHQRQCK